MASNDFLVLTRRLSAGDDSAAGEMAGLADRGDPDAQYMVAEFRLLGLHGPVDIAAAHRLVASAAALGHGEARRTLAYFTANGTGCKPNLKKAVGMLQKLAPTDRFVQVQLAFLQHVTCDERLKKAERKVISSDPYVALIPGLFSSEECRYIRILGAPWLEPAMIVTDQGPRQNPIRNSDNTAIVPVAEDLVIQAFNRCIADATGTKTSFGEPLTILRYGPGQQYRPHHDAYGQEDPQAARHVTALVWLNDEYEGGETHFPVLGLKVRGAIGDMLIFHNLTPDLQPDPRLVHAGLPVIRGEKWMASRWIRNRPYIG